MLSKEDRKKVDEIVAENEAANAAIVNEAIEAIGIFEGRVSGRYICVEPGGVHLAPGVGLCIRDGEARLLKDGFRIPKYSPEWLDVTVSSIKRDRAHRAELRKFLDAYKAAPVDPDTAAFFGIGGEDA